MKAMVLKQLCTIAENKSPLELVDMPDPVPRDNEILIKVSSCGVCHTELDEIEGRTPPPRLPIILGHQVVGRVDTIAAGATKFRKGDRVGLAWIHSACGRCEFCTSRLVINAIRKEESDKKSLLALDYANHLWLEKEIKSVANVARTDVGEILQLAAEIQIRPEVQEFELKDANRALVELKERKIRGAKVLKIN